MFGFDIWSSYLRQAYLQATEPQDKDIFIRDAVPEFAFKSSQCLKLLKAIYGLCKSVNLEHGTPVMHHREHLGM